MSLDSYKKVIKAQRKREHGFERDFPADTHSIDRELKERIQFYERLNKRKYGVVPIIISVIFIVILLAAITNPSTTDAEADIKSLIVDKYNDTIREEINGDDDTSAGEQVGAAFATALGPLIIDHLVDIDVSDYILFSTFNSQVTIKGEDKTIVAGVIIFGKVIPLESDINKESLEKP